MRGEGGERDGKEARGLEEEYKGQAQYEAWLDGGLKPVENRREEHHRLGPQSAILGRAQAQGVDTGLPGQFRWCTAQ